MYSLCDVVNSITKYIISAAKNVFIGKTSAVVAYCHINGENANIPILNSMELLVYKLGLVDNLIDRPIKAAARLVKTSEDKLTKYAGVK